MRAQMAATRSTAFRAGRIALLAMSALATISYAALMFVFRDEATVFLGWSAYTLYAFVVVLIPFQRGQRWAWYASWIHVVGFAAPILLTAESFAVWDFLGAVLMTLALLLTRPAFFRRGTHAN